MFRGFSKNGLELLAKIERNNTKEWFDAHKSDYETYILEPSRAFVVEMGEHLQALVPTIHAVPKVNQSLFRIYRDSRFHSLVDPIKTHIGVIFWQGGGKRMMSSSFYMHFDARSVLLAAGIRRFKPEMLHAYREYIKPPERREALHAILERLSAKGHSLPEPRYKRYPKGFSKEDSNAYLALFDGMYAYSELAPPESFFTAAFPDEAYRVYEEMYELQQWVYEMTLTFD